MPNKQHNRRGARITRAQEDHATRRGIPRFLAFVPADAEEEQSMGGQRGRGEGRGRMTRRGSILLPSTSVSDSDEWRAGFQRTLS